MNSSLEQDIKNIFGKHIKQTLARLEILYDSPVHREERKIILDEYNDGLRELYILLAIKETT